MSRWMRFVPAWSTVKNLPRQDWLRRPLVRNIMVCVGMFLVGGIAFVIGRSIGLGSIVAQPPGLPRPATDASYDNEYAQRVVAYIYGNIPVTRMELAEHLIARYGGERLEFLVNRKIVEKACQERGIIITDLMVEQQFQSDLKKLGNAVTPKVFQEQVLKRYNKTVFEWKEDVIRPKLAMAALVKPEIHVTDEDLHKGFEGRYGAKVLCRMIVYKDKHDAVKGWERIKAGTKLEDAFMAEAGVQYVAQLAATKGEIPPIHKHFGDASIEREVFNLQPGQISQVIGMPDGTHLIFLCVSKLPPLDKRYEEEKTALYAEIFDIKLSEAIPKKVQALRAAAAPRFLINRQPTMEQLQRDVEAELNSPLNFRGVEGKQ